MLEPDPLLEMQGISLAFGGNQAVDNASLTLFSGEVLGLVGHNGAGKTTLIKIVAGAHAPDAGHIMVNGKPVSIASPADAKACGIETIYQNLALADNLDAVANIFLGRELVTGWGTLDDVQMQDQARRVLKRLNPNFTRFTDEVRLLSGGQRQSVAIARALLFNARVIIMDEPTAALGPAETAQVWDLIQQLKSEGIGVFLISHDIHDLYGLSDRICVMKGGHIVGVYRASETDPDEILNLIVGGSRSSAS